MKKTSRKWKKRKEDLRELLRTPDFSDTLSVLLREPPRQVINPLMSLFLTGEEIIRWRAITAAGRVGANLADQDMEGARVIMRRFMWMLNDESGGIGWGVPEAMGEAVAVHDRLGEEFADLLVSYVCPERNYLEYEALQRGALWAIGRVAEVKPHLVKEGKDCVIPHLAFQDATVRGLSARAAGLLGVEAARENLKGCLDDDREISLFVDNALVTSTVSGLARAALSKLPDGQTY
jgi:hypothetical protein